MSQSIPDFPQVTQLAIPFFIGAILAEIAWIRLFDGKGEFETRDTLTSLLMGNRFKKHRLDPARGRRITPVVRLGWAQKASERALTGPD